MLTFQGEKFVCAKEWRSIEGAPSARKLSTLAQSQTIDGQPVGGIAFHVVEDHGEKETLLGLYTETQGKSLEATLANCVDDDGFYLIEQDDGLVALVIIEHGQIIPHSGVTGDLTDVESELASIQASLFFGESVLPMIVSSQAIADSLGHMGHENVVVQPLPDLICEDGFVSLSSVKKKKDSLFAVVTMLTVTAGVLGGGGYYTYQEMFAKPDAKPGMTEEEKLEQQRKEFLSDQREAASRLIPEKRDWPVSTLTSLLERYRVSAYGWQFDGMECSLSSEKCTLVWRGAEGQASPVEPFADRLDVDVDSLSLSTADNGTLNYSIDADGAGLPGFVSFDDEALSDLPSVATFSRPWWEVIQVQRVRLPGVSIAQPNQMKKVVPQATPPGVPVVAYEGKTEINGQSIAELEAAIDAVDVIPASPIRLVYVDGQGQSNNEAGWKIEVQYVGQQ